MIPARARFVWLGPRLQPLAYLSMRSALDRGGFEEVSLYHDDDALADDPLVRDLAARPGFRLVPLDLRDLAARDAAAPDGLAPSTWARLLALDRMISSPAVRSDLHRLEVLWMDGGVYLDTDVIVLRDFGPLLTDGGFAGLERICFPMKVKGGYNPLRWMQGGLLTAVRAGVCARSPHPSRPFRRISRFYFHTPVNAVLGAVPHHPLIRVLVERAAALDDAAARRTYRLGPWLLQEVVGSRSRPGFRVHAPHLFHPFPPEVNVDYIRPDPEAELGPVPHPDSYAAHLWDSVLKLRLGHPVDAAYLRRTRGQTMLTRMTAPYLDRLFALRACL